MPILVFAKLPRAGHAKTRLAQELGPERAAGFAAAFLEDTLERVRHWGRGPLWLCGDQPSAGAFRHFLGPDIHYHPQGGGDLGARLQRAFQQAFANGASGAVALGADTPHLPLELLDQAVAGVQAGQVVLGPARDGGYFLLAVPETCVDLEAILSGCEWGTSKVLSQTRQTLMQCAVPYLELELFWDIDRCEDLVQWSQELRSRGAPHPAPKRSLRLLQGLEGYRGFLSSEVPPETKDG
ncbi:MAG: TIGR04282 family arsenosugar biosynthesis glycosyltransferase [Planctomycetota bacterium]